MAGGGWGSSSHPTRFPVRLSGVRGGGEVVLYHTFGSRIGVLSCLNWRCSAMLRSGNSLSNFSVFFVQFLIPNSIPSSSRQSRKRLTSPPEIQKYLKNKRKHISHSTHHSHTPQWGNPCCHAKKEKATYNRPLNRGGRPSGFPFGTALRRHRRAFLHPCILGCNLGADEGSPLSPRLHDNDG